MSPRPADPAVRTALIDAASRLIADDGGRQLTLRRVAEEVGASTMSVYTHFGGMDELRREVRREGFARLAAHLAELRASRDPVADLTLIGWAYYRSATTNPSLYRVMFMEQPLDEADAAVGQDTFESLVEGVHRCRERFTAADPVQRATELWACTHGLVTLELAACLPPEQALGCLLTTARNLYLAYGDDATAASRSVSSACRRAGIPKPPPLPRRPRVSAG